MEPEEAEYDPFASAFCSVCGEPAPAVHYGALSCAGCAAFFKRSVLRNKDENCSHGGLCPVTPTTRSQCRACRFQKCVRAGMEFTAKEKRSGPSARKKQVENGTGSSAYTPNPDDPASSSRDGRGSSHSYEDISDASSMHDPDAETEEGIAAFLKEYEVNMMDSSAGLAIDGAVGLSDLNLDFLEQFMVHNSFGEPAVPIDLMPSTSASSPCHRTSSTPEMVQLNLTPEAQYCVRDIVNSVAFGDMWLQPTMDNRPKITDNSFRPYSFTNAAEPPVADGFRFSEFMEIYYPVIQDRLSNLEATLTLVEAAWEQIFPATLIRTAVTLIQGALNRVTTPQHEASFDEVLIQTRGFLTDIQLKSHDYMSRTPGFELFSITDRETLITDTCMESLLVADGFTWDEDRIHFRLADTKVHINEYGIRAIFDKEFVEFAFEVGRHYQALDLHDHESCILLASVMYRPGGARVKNTELLGFLHTYYLDLLIYTVSRHRHPGFSSTKFIRHLTELFQLLHRSPEMTERCKRALRYKEKPSFYN